MAKPLKKINSIAYEILNRKFKDLLIKGEFPNVNYKQTDYGHSYDMIAYSTVWAKYTKAVHTKLTDSFEFGLWHNARNQTYRDEVHKISDALTVEEIENSDSFRTMFG